MARHCEHGRQITMCGDCWNPRCDICKGTLDQVESKCLEHGVRTNPLPPLMEERQAQRKECAVEAHKEYENLKQHWDELRNIITPTAAMVTWLALGDEMWVKK